MVTLALLMLALLVLALALVGAGTIYVVWRLWESYRR